MFDSGCIFLDASQGTKSLCDSGEVRLVLSTVPKGEIVASGGSALS